MVTKGLALIFSHNIKPYTKQFTMTVQNQQSVDFLKNKFSLGQTQRDFSGFGNYLNHN